MSQTERARLLDEYRTVSERLLTLFQEADKFLDLGRMNDCLSTRDQLGMRVQELAEAGVPVQADEQEQLHAILALDEQVTAAMRAMMKATQRELVQLRTVKQGLNHYRDEYSVEAYFIDSKK